MMYTTDEIKAVADAADAVTSGMMDVFLSDDEAAVERLQKVLDALLAVYPDAVEWCFAGYIEITK